MCQSGADRLRLIAAILHSSHMSQDQNKAVVRRFIEELWNQRKLEVADELFAADCVTHQLRGSDPAAMPRSPESVKAEAAAWFAAFPDLRFEIEQMFAEGNQVFSRFTMRGTNTGAWMGLPPTNRKVSVPMMTIHRIHEGKIAEDWVLIGTLILLQQLGILPDTTQILERAGKSETAY